MTTIMEKRLRTLKSANNVLTPHESYLDDRSQKAHCATGNVSDARSNCCPLDILCPDLVPDGDKLGHVAELFLNKTGTRTNWGGGCAGDS